ncbi:MAG: hypothetical protein ABSF69_09800 [Polyangiaceae bacterium]
MMRSLRIGIGLVTAVVSAAAALAPVACGGGDDDIVPVPIPDGGAAAGGDAGDAGSRDATVATDGGCVSDSTTCNSCTTSEADPSNQCSAFTSACTAFDAARVPQHPTL